MKKIVYTLSCSTIDKYNELAFASHADIVQFFEEQEANIQKIIIRGEYFFVFYKIGKVEIIELIRRTLIDY